MPTLTITCESALSDYAAALALQTLLRQRGVTYYLGLHTDHPDGPTPNELEGGEYVRDNISFSAPSGRAIASTNGQAFHGVLADTVRYLGVWDAVINGNLILVLDLGGATLPTWEDGSVLLAAGDVAFRF